MVVGGGGGGGGGRGGGWDRWNQGGWRSVSHCYSIATARPRFPLHPAATEQLVHRAEHRGFAPVPLPQQPHRRPLFRHALLVDHADVAPERTPAPRQLVVDRVLLLGLFLSFLPFAAPAARELPRPGLDDLPRLDFLEAGRGEAVVYGLYFCPIPLSPCKKFT